MKCPNGHEEVSLKEVNKKFLFRGVEISVFIEQYCCAVCDLVFGTVEQAFKIQNDITRAYFKKLEDVRLETEEEEN